MVTIQTTKRRKEAMVQKIRKRNRRRKEWERNGRRVRIVKGPGWWM